MDPGELVRLVTRVLRDERIPHFVTGATATIIYGEPRLTNDVDLVVRLDPGRVDALLARFPPEEFYLDREAVERAIAARTSFNLIHPSSGLKVDFMITDESPFDHSRFARVREIEIGGGERASFAAPEDVILKKLEYFREGASEKHLRDIAGILRISGEELDREYLDSWAERLGLSKEWERARRQAS